MNKEIQTYNSLLSKEGKKICNLLAKEVNAGLPEAESKIWHRTAVWFLDGNPIVAYSVRKGDRISVMFFSGQSFEEIDLTPEGKFKAAEVFYANVEEIKITQLKRWLRKSKEIQWDYKHIVKRKGVLKKIVSPK